MLQTAVLPATTSDGAAVECAAVLLPYKPHGSSSSTENPRVGGPGPPGDFYGVLAMPRGQLGDSVTGVGGDRGLATANGGVVPYRDALAACRHSLLAHLPGPAGAAEGRAGGGVWQWDGSKEVKLHLPRQDCWPPCTLTLGCPDACRQSQSQSIVACC